MFRFWADLQFLVVALRRLRRAASIAKFNPVVASAIADFDRALPGLSHMRNVAEHVDEYAVDSPRRGNKQIFRQSLQVGFWGDPVYKWLGYELNVDEAVAAADALFIAVRTASELP